MMFMFFASALVFLILLLFFLLSKKEASESLNFSVFECGFTTYFFSRFSFSIHYFTIGLIFLFLDLELCYIMPLFNEDFLDINSNIYLTVFVLILVLGLLEEWGSGMLEWKF